MSIVIICLIALVASTLTFFSGFGLGTLLLPAFAFYFPLPQAVAMTAVVHFFNNLFKAGIIYKSADWKIVWRFGLFSIPAAIIGAWLLHQSQTLPEIAGYVFLTFNAHVTWQGVIIGLVMIGFALYESLADPKKSTSQREKPLWLGGIISGFFGGLSGHQGALRSAWLINIIGDKTAYVATGTMIAILVDISRMGVYAGDMKMLNFQTQWSYLLLPILCAFVGVIIGNRLLKKITIRFVRTVVCMLLIIFGTLTALGLLNKH